LTNELEIRALYLLNRVLSAEATESELAELAELIRSDESGLLTSRIASLLDEKRVEAAFSGRDWEAVTTRILQADKRPNEDKKLARPLVFQMARRVAAAAIILLVAGAAYFFLARPSKAEMAKTGELRKGSGDDILPGANKAVLTLGNGSTIILDSAHTGNLAMQGGAAVVKVDSGQLVYHAGKGNTTDIVYNTLTTPKGGQFELVLPDGTKLWLNAASSVTYPTAFTGDERKVLVTGEAYFEVHKNVSQPFKVFINGKEEIEVLGTTFNVNGYADERDIKTTLLEGSVRVTEAEAQVTGIAHVGVNTNMSKLSVVLKPGQQAQLVVGENTNNGGGDGDMKIKLLTNQAQDQIVAWKNGLFNFTGADLETVMRQLARWYDVEVVYERDIPKMKFVGEMQRELNLLDVLDVLKRTDVHFRIEGRKIIVLP